MLGSAHHEGNSLSSSDDEVRLILMELEIRHLRLVAAVAAVGSLTRAGDQLH